MANWIPSILMTGGAAYGANFGARMMREEADLSKKVSLPIISSALGTLGGLIVGKAINGSIYYIKSAAVAFQDLADCYSKEPAQPCSELNVTQNMMTLLPVIITVTVLGTYCLYSPSKEKERGNEVSAV